MGEGSRRLNVKAFASRRNTTAICHTLTPLYSDGRMAQRPAVLNISLYCLQVIIFWAVLVDSSSDNWSLTVIK